jgi:hypothetical protein
VAEGINIFVSGRTGTGKSHLVKQAIADCPRLLVYLPKREDHGYAGVYFDGMQEGSRQLMLEWWRHCEKHGRRFRLVYRPRDAYDFTEFDQICGLVYACADMHFVCEELGTYVSPSIFKRTDYALRFKTLIQAGRTRGIFTWLLNQRPTGIPPELKSEARLAYLFHSNEPPDVEYIKNKFGVAAAEKLAALQEHEYVRWTETGEVTTGKANP